LLRIESSNFSCLVILVVKVVSTLQRSVGVARIELAEYRMIGASKPWILQTSSRLLARLKTLYTPIFLDAA
jgi:hypothetical protein